MDRRLFLLAIAVFLLPACRQTPAVRSSAASGKAIKTRPVICPAPPLPDSVCIAAVGDIMPGTAYPDKSTLPPGDGKNSFLKVKDELHHADVTFGNLEGVLLDTGVPAHHKLHLLSKGYLFRIPQRYGRILKEAGFNLFSLANNHTADFGGKGLASTMRILDSLGIHYGGILGHPSSIFKVNGITYGFCAFSPNSQALSLLDLKNARRVIHRLKKRCDIVIVSFHGGNEGPGSEHVPFKDEYLRSENRGNVYAFAHNAVDAGADLILGNGPHICRALELYQNRLIAYSLGNFCTYKGVSISGISGIAPLLKVYLNKQGKFLSGRIIATYQTHEKGLAIDPFDRAINKMRELTDTDFAASGIIIQKDGRIILKTLPAGKAIAAAALNGTGKQQPISK